MSVLSFLKNIFGSTDGKAYVVDASSLGEKGRPGRLSPREQIDILKRLSKFAEQEAIRITAVFDGQPLRVVEDGGDFSGVRVFFTGEKIARDKLVLKQFRRASGSEVMVITADTELESRIRGLGGHVMRSSTFSKALEPAKAGESPRGGRRRRRPRNKKPSDGDAPQEGRSDEPRGRGQDRVRELIDLVD